MFKTKKQQVKEVKEMKKKLMNLIIDKDVPHESQLYEDGVEVFRLSKDGNCFFKEVHFQWAFDKLISSSFEREYEEMLEYLEAL